ncbi:MAG: hypothetical protein AB7I38_17865 [Dehalococcoidia bacterium]
MVEFDLFAALVAGAAATAVMSAMMTMAASAGMTDMPSMPLVTGSMIAGSRGMAMRIGSAMHYLMMGTIVFGLAYAALFTAFDDDSWWVGALFGLAHGVILGVVFMPMMPAVHPRMRHELVGVAVPGGRGTVAVDEAGEVQLAAPGVLGMRWGGMTPVGMLMGHVVYGLVAALVYGAVAS